MSTGELSPRLLGPDGEVRDRIFGFETEYAAIANVPDAYIESVLRDIEARRQRDFLPTERKPMADWEGQNIMRHIIGYAYWRTRSEYTV